MVVMNTLYEEKAIVTVHKMLDWETGKCIGCYMDEFELTTYIGRHVVSQELRMVGEDYRVSHVHAK